MKIALIHIRLMNKGGLETRLINYMNYFLQRGDEVTIITSKISGEVILPKNVSLIKIELSKFPKFIRHLFFNYQLEKELNKYSFDYILSLERTWCQDHLIAPNTHIGFLKAQNQWWRDPSDIVQLYLDKKSFTNSKHIYACSQMVKEEIIENYHIDSSKIKVVFPPLNKYKFNLDIRKNRDAFQKKHGIDNLKTNFLFVSTSHKRKGLELLIRIFSKPENADKHLYIAGSSTVHTQKNIHTLGYVSDTQELYVAVDATLHPAIYEPFGQIVSESIACGTYVFVSKKVGAQEIISNNDLGKIIDIQNEHEWEQAIHSFVKNNKLDENLIQKITQELSLEVHMKKICPF